MTPQPVTETDVEQNLRRGRGPNRPFPAMKFEEALTLPESIMEHGLNGEIQRLTLFSKLERSPDSGPTRAWLSGSSRYGLTKGSYSAPSLSVTDDGKTALEADRSPRVACEKRYDLAIAKFECFRSLYDKVKNHRLPDEAILADELKQLGVSESDSKKASEVFTANLRFLGLIQIIAGAEHVRTIEDVLAEIPENPTHVSEESSQSGPAVEPRTDPVAAGTAPLAANYPALHVDIQVHIDPAASTEQIEQIFASMARHLYGRES